MLIDALKIGFLDNTKSNLPIYGVKSSSLQLYEKSTQDVRRGVKTKEPNDLFRLEEEDLLRMNLDQAIDGLDEDDEEEEKNQPNPTYKKIEEAKRVEYIDIGEIGKQINEFQVDKNRVIYQASQGPEYNFESSPFSMQELGSRASGSSGSYKFSEMEIRIRNTENNRVKKMKSNSELDEL